MSSAPSRRSYQRPTASSASRRSRARSTTSPTWRSSWASPRARRTCSYASTPPAPPATRSAPPRRPPIRGEPGGKGGVLVRVPPACLTGDALRSLRCDCGEQLEAAMQLLAREGEGVIVYMQQEGRGIGLLNKMKAYHLQDEGMDTVEANQKLGLTPDLRDYGVAAQVLKDLELTRIRLLTNNLTKVVGLRGFGLKITERVPLEIEPNGHNDRYLKTKREKLNHVFDKI